MTTAHSSTLEIEAIRLSKSHLLARRVFFLLLVLFIFGCIGFSLLPLTKASPSKLITGSVTMLPYDLHLLSDPSTYYTAGEYDAGEYTGYTRVIGVDNLTDLAYTFLTINFSSYILNADPSKINMYPVTDVLNPLYHIEKTYIQKVAEIPSDISHTIYLPNGLSLYQTGIYTTKNRLQTHITGISLPSPSSSYSLYLLPYTSPNSTTFTDQQEEDTLTEAQYIQSTTNLILVDSTGLAFRYNMATSKSIAMYPQKLQAYENAVKAYPSKLSAYMKSVNNGAGIVSYPIYPQAPQLPHLLLTSSDIQTNESIYHTYASADPLLCKNNDNTFILKNISANDLTKIGTWGNLSVYSLVDQNHPLYHLAYDTKTESLANEDFIIQNGIDMPSIDSYIMKHPLLVIPNPFGGYILLQEADFELAISC